MKKNAFGKFALIIGFIYFGVMLIYNLLEIFSKQMKDVTQYAFAQNAQMGASVIFRIVINCMATLVILMWLIYAAKGSEDFGTRANATLGYRVLLLLYRLATIFLFSKWSMFFQTLRNNAEELIIMVVILLAWLCLARWQSRKGEIAFLILRLGVQLYVAKGFASTFKVPLITNGKFDFYNLIFVYVKDIVGYLSIIFIVLYIVYPRAFKHD